MEFLRILEELHNSNFNYGEFAIIKSQADLNRKIWGEKLNTFRIALIVGRYGEYRTNLTKSFRNDIKL